VKPIYRTHVASALDRDVPRLLGYQRFPLTLTKAERKDATLFPGSCVYSRDTPKGLLFIHVIPHRRQEELLAEVGWSRAGRFPVALSSHGPLTTPADEMLEPEWLIDFGSLYHRKHGRGFFGWAVWRCSVDFDHPDFTKIFMTEDRMPVSDDEAKRRADQAVTACINDLQEVAVPYLDRRVSSA
jgi:hypothetical protein